MYCRNLLAQIKIISIGHENFFPVSVKPARLVKKFMNQTQTQLQSFVQQTYLLTGTGSAGTINVELIKLFSFAFGHFPIHFPYGTIPSQAPHTLAKFLLPNKVSQSRPDARQPRCCVGCQPANQCREFLFTIFRVPALPALLMVTLSKTAMCELS